MVKKVLASTVSEWQFHFNENPNQSIPEYRIDWTTIRNNAEGIGVEVGFGTVNKYLSIFRNDRKLGNSFGPEGLVEPVIEPVVEPVIKPTSIETILEARANVVGLRIAIEKYIADLATIESTLDNALSIASDNALFVRLESDNIRLGSEAQAQRERANMAEDTAKAERELRIHQGETHSGSTR